jgi:hypothetical protein
VGGILPSFPCIGWPRKPGAPLNASQAVTCRLHAMLPRSPAAHPLSSSIPAPRADCRNSPRFGSPRSEISVTTITRRSGFRGRRRSSLKRSEEPLQWRCSRTLSLNPNDNEEWRSRTVEIIVIGYGVLFETIAATPLEHENLRRSGVYAGYHACCKKLVLPRQNTVTDKYFDQLHSES